MTTSRAIVGIGELLLHVEGGSERVGGLAGLVPLHAARLGHRAVAVSRIGQDAVGERLLRELREHGVSVDHLQTDPDLRTGRLTLRTLGSQTTRLLDSRAAFDNIQWDGDLAEIAQKADAVVFGLLARRCSQTRQTIVRFVDAAREALTVFNVMNRGEDPFDRPAVARVLDEVTGALLDREILHALCPGAGDPDDVLGSLLLRRHHLTFLILQLADCRWRIFTGGETVTTDSPIDASATEAALVALLHGLLSGWDWSRSLAGASRYAQFVVDHPDLDEAAVPADLFDAT